MCGSGLAVVSAAVNPIPKTFHLGKGLSFPLFPLPQGGVCSVLSQDSEM